MTAAIAKIYVRVIEMKLPAIMLFSIYIAPFSYYLFFDFDYYLSVFSFFILRGENDNNEMYLKSVSIHKR